MTQRTKREGYIAVILFLTLLASAPAQTKPKLDPADYGRWESFADRPVLSPDGQWLAYGVNRVDQQRELRVSALAQDIAPTTLPWGERPSFSDTSEWLAWAIGPSIEEKKRLEKEDKPVRMGAGLLELGKGTPRKFDEVKSLSFDATGRFLVLFGYAPKEPKGVGAALRLLDLEGDTETSFGNIGEYSWSEEGSLLALTISSGRDEGNGAQVYDAQNGRLRSLHTSHSRYQALSWAEKSSSLAFLRSAEAASSEASAQILMAARGLEAAAAVISELKMEQLGSEQKLEISKHRGPVWSEDGELISFGLRPPPQGASDESGEEKDPSDQPAEDKQKEGKEELPDLQIWHTSDVRLFPEQKVAEERDKTRTLLAVWQPESGRVVQIGSALMERTELLHGWVHALEWIEAPYPWGAMFGRPYRDVWLVEVATGKKRQIGEKLRYAWPSSEGQYLLAFDGEHYWAENLRTQQRVNLTEDLPTSFADTEYDTPTDLQPPHGVAGWLKDDTAVLLYDRFDVWQVAPGGTAGKRLTRGAEEEVVHRVVDLDPDEVAIDSSQPIYLSIHGEWSEKRGYARLEPGTDQAEKLLFADGRVSGLRQADDAGVFVYRMEARHDSPDYYVAGADLATPRSVTRTNPFQDDYGWTKSQLFEFQSESGKRLQAALLYPINHDSSRRYPMIVYTYEILSPQVHTYEVPSERDYYNFTAWTQEGYFVLLPDIVYRAREPGISALEAVRPAVAKVVELGLADPDRVGLVGHSWGGYQATYLPTRSKIFAASVAGAPLTDFVSFMGQIHWRSGNAELSHWETGQARMEVPYWEDPEAHHRNSPIHKVQEMETPLLMAFGSDDGVVDWDQGTEFYNFARRAGKQMVLLVYEGEGHGFRKEANQIDYHRRILEWFGHYLKGEPAPQWISEGIRLEELEKEKRRVAEKGKTGTEEKEPPAKEP